MLLFGLAAWSVLAQTGATGGPAALPDFSPPPVPEFMLRKPAKPLTLEEMQRQADEAAERARRDAGTPPPGAVSPAPTPAAPPEFAMPPAPGQPARQ